MEPRLLSVEQVIRLHANQIDAYGGQLGVRDHGLLESAVAQPSAMYGGQFLCGDLADMAAAYLFHIACNHPFLDGNKRAGAVAAFVFLDANGVELTASEEAFEAMVMAVANGSMSKARVAEWFRANCTGRLSLS